MKDEKLEPNEEREDGPGEVNPVGGSGENDETAPGGNEAAGLDSARVDELTAQLETLRAESSVQLEALRAENALQLEAYCNLARSLPGVVPELVSGATLEAVQTSLATAREAYSRVAANLTVVAPGNSGEVILGPGPGAGGGARNGLSSSEDQPARLSSERGVNLIYQAIAGGKSGNLAR